MNRIWMVAAVPLALMLLMFCGFWMKPRFADTASPVTCVSILSGAVVTGLCVLFIVLRGWWRGAYTLSRGDILAATAFAALDVLIPTGLVILIWLLIRSLKNSGGILMF
ncbi:MAG TPA: hypothetical protein VGW12_05820 [Pyrinomonadaceae bacterium]|nr:hypothetical protein [Pyrinomonadaceae bacterium]